MNSDKKHIVYTAEDIQKYLSGALASAEMHAMEKAALDDAFLADAMEGYNGMQDQEWESHLSSLKAQFAKAPTAPVVSMRPAAKRFPIWRVAAAVIIICSGVAVSYFLNTNDAGQNNSIAVVNTKNDSIKSTSSESIVANTDSNLFASVIPSTAKEQPAIAKAKQRTFVDSSFVYKPEAGNKKEVAQTAGGGYIDDLQKGRTSDVTNNNIAPINTQNNAEQIDTRSKKISNQPIARAEEIKETPAPLDRKFMAQVLAPDGSPLPFANINIPDQNMGTYADAKGNVRLISSDSILQVEIKSAGFISRNVTLRSDIAQNKIMLTEDMNALKGKTQVAGKLSVFGPKRRAVLVPDSVIDVEPADGWNNYDTYITNNLSLTEDIVQKKIHGEVEISFEVQSNGALANIKIDKSLCEECDEAALRAVKEGPRWKIKKGKKATGKVTVKF